MLPEVLDDDLDFLGDVVGMQPDPAHDLLAGRAAFGLLVVQLLAVVGEFKGQLVGRVVLQDIEDEDLLDGLPNEVHVERRRHVVLARGSGGVRPRAEQLHLVRLGPGRYCLTGSDKT